MMHDIDFVLTYLDPNDVEWQRERNQYMPGKNADVNPNRYREWDNLQYLFRGIEKYAPWVRKIHIVTCGHIPVWLNTEHPKVNIVKHSDFIPAEWLPTFSSRAIDLNLHRIPGLADHFVYFNDDMFITSPVKPEDFFKNGLPCDSAILNPYSSVSRENIQMYIAPLVDTSVINHYFNRRSVVRHNVTKWINPKYGAGLFRTLLMLPYPNFCGFFQLHIPYSYKKSTYEKVWELENERLCEVSSHKFRETLDCNHWIFSYWQYATGEFHPRRISFGRIYQLQNILGAERAKKDILAHRYKTVCLNDAIGEDSEFEKIVQTVNSGLETILPEKCKIEL